MATDIWLSQNEKLSAYIETDAKNLKQNFKSLSKQVDNIFDRDVNWNEVQWVIKEALVILDIVKAKWNTDLYLKFRKNYEELFRLITQSYENDKKISLAERQEIVLELSDVIKLAQSENIIEEKDLQTKVKDWFERSSASDSKEKSLDLRTKQAKDYTSDEALWAISYLNKNYQKFWKVQANSTEDSYLSKTIDELTNFSIEDVTNQNQADLLSKIAIKKALDNDAYSKTYIQWYDNLEWNKIIKISDFEQELKTKDIKDINSKALGNYFLYLKSKWNLNEEFLINNFPPNFLMWLGNLWENEWIEFSWITKDILLNNWLKDFVETVKIFRSTESIVKQIKVMFENKDIPDDKKFQLGKTLTLFIHKCSIEIVQEVWTSISNMTNLKIDSIKNDKLLTEENKQQKIELLLLAKDNLIKDISDWLNKDPIDIKNLVRKIWAFGEWNNVDLPLREYYAAELRADAAIKEKEHAEAIIEKQQIESELNTKTEVLAIAKIKWDTDVANKINKEIKDLKKEVEVSKKEVITSWEKANLANIKVTTYNQATVDQKEDLLKWKTTFEEVAQKNRAVNEYLDKKLRHYENISAYNNKKLNWVKEIIENEEKKKEDEENNNSNINWKHNDQELASIRRENYEHNNFVNTSNWVLYKTWENWIVYKPTSVDLKLQENRKYKQNLNKFVLTLNELWANDFREIREEIFWVISNLKWWEALKPDSQKFNKQDTINFLSLIIKSAWFNPNNWTLEDIKKQFDELNKSNTAFKGLNNKSNNNLFEKFKELYFVDWRLDTIKLEKALRQPNNTNNNPENKTKKEAVIA